VFWNSPSWRASEWWAAAFLIAPFVVGAIILELRHLKKSKLLGLIAGTDGRWSTSKTSNVLWVFAVCWAFIAIILHSAGSDLGSALDLKEEYLIVLGIPTGTAVLAKAVTKGNVASGKVSTKPSKGPETNVADGLGQLVGNDAGNIDLLDLQYFTFNLVLLGFFFLTFLHAQEQGLPSLPQTLFALSGVSAAGYVAKKTQEEDIDPAIASIVPQPCKAGQHVTIYGSRLVVAASGALGAPPVAPTVTIDGTVATVAPPSPTATLTEPVVVTIPAHAAVGSNPVVVTNSLGRQARGSVTIVA
jgi:IPT/TIG domain